MEDCHGFRIKITLAMQFFATFCVLLFVFFRFLIFSTLITLFAKLLRFFRRILLFRDILVIFETVLQALVAAGSWNEKISSNLFLVYSSLSLLCVSQLAACFNPFNILIFRTSPRIHLFHSLMFIKVCFLMSPSKILLLGWEALLSVFNAQYTLKNGVFFLEFFELNFVHYYMLTEIWIEAVLQLGVEWYVVKISVFLRVILEKLEN